MRERREFDLKWDGRACVVDELGSLPARQVARRILNIVGKAAREASSGASIEANVVEIGMRGAGGVLEQLDDATMTWLTTTFLAVTSVESEPGSGEYVSLKDVSELAFRGAEGLARWMRWLTYCLETSCGDFFVAAFAEFQRLRPAKGQQTPNMASGSPSTSSTPGTFTA